MLLALICLGVTWSRPGVLPIARLAKPRSVRNCREREKSLAKEMKTRAKKGKKELRLGLLRALSLRAVGLQALEHGSGVPGPHLDAPAALWPGESPGAKRQATTS